MSFLYPPSQQIFLSFFLSTELGCFIDCIWWLTFFAGSILCVQTMFHFECLLPSLETCNQPFSKDSLHEFSCSPKKQQRRKRGQGQRGWFLSSAIIQCLAIFPRRAVYQEKQGSFSIWKLAHVRLSQLTKFVSVGIKKTFLHTDGEPRSISIWSIIWLSLCHSKTAF